MASSPIPALAPSTTAPSGFCTWAVIWSTTSSSDSLRSGIELLRGETGDGRHDEAGEGRRDGDADGARIRRHDAEALRGRAQIAPVRERRPRCRRWRRRSAACTSSSRMPTEGISSSGGSPAIGARLLPTKSPSNPSTTQSPVMSMADSGSSGVTRASASRNGRSRGSPSPIPTSSSSGPSTRSPWSRTAAPARSSSAAGMPKRR